MKTLEIVLIIILIVLLAILGVGLYFTYHQEKQEAEEEHEIDLCHNWFFAVSRADGHVLAHYWGSGWTMEKDGNWYTIYSTNEDGSTHIQVLYEGDDVSLAYTYEGEECGQ